MKFRCMKCFELEGKPSDEVLLGELQDSALYHISCTKGHNTVVRLQNNQFERLFDLGCMALVDGYTREAVSNFVSAVERFHEFCIKVFVKKNEIQYEQFITVWNYVNKQSERQLGAFYFLYLQIFNEIPPAFVINEASFRNDVTHNGHIPTDARSLKFAEDTYNYIKNIFIKLKETLIKELKKSTHEDIVRLNKESKLAGDSCVMAWRGFFNVCGTDLEPRSFKEELEDFKKQMTILYSRN